MTARLVSLIGFVVITGAPSAYAQELAASAPVALPAPSPVFVQAPATRSAPPDLASAAIGWVTEGTKGSPTVAAKGPLLRVTTPSAVTIASAAVTVNGAYTVRATFHREAGNSGAYGFALGGDGTSATTS